MLLETDLATTTGTHALVKCAAGLRSSDRAMPTPDIRYGGYSDIDSEEEELEHGDEFATEAESTCPNLDALCRRTSTHNVIVVHIYIIRWQHSKISI